MLHGIVFVIIVTSSLIIQVICNKCPVGHSVHFPPNRCVFIPYSHPGDFVSCIHECNRNNASVAVLNSNNEMRIVSSNLLGDSDIHADRDMAWLGIVRITSEKLTDRAFRQLDGSRLNFSKWLEDDPNNYNNHQNCVVLLSRGLMDDYDCDSQDTIHCLCESEEGKLNQRKSAIVVDKFLLQLVREKAILKGEIHEMGTWILLMVVLISFFTIVLVFLLKFKSYPVSNST